MLPHGSDWSQTFWASPEVHQVGTVRQSKLLAELSEQSHCVSRVSISQLHQPAVAFSTSSEGSWGSGQQLKTSAALSPHKAVVLEYLPATVTRGELASTHSVSTSQHSTLSQPNRLQQEEQERHLVPLPTTKADCLRLVPRCPGTARMVNWNATCWGPTPNPPQMALLTSSPAGRQNSFGSYK